MNAPFNPRFRIGLDFPSDISRMDQWLEELPRAKARCTSSGASRIGRQFATCGSSQRRTLEMIANQMGAKIGNAKLRRIVTTVAVGMQRHGQQERVDKLIELIEVAREEVK